MGCKNQPAFPVLMQQVGDNEFRAHRPGDPLSYTRPMAGLTKREYFAAVAPNDIPEWFEHVEPERPDVKFPNIDDVEDVNDWKILDKWIWSVKKFALPDHLAWFGEQWAEAHKKRKEWEKADAAARYFQWRKYYADMMIAELSK